MFTCPLCDKNYILISSLCESCKQIKRFGNIYGIEKIYSILHEILTNKEHIINEKIIEVKGEID